MGNVHTHTHTGILCWSGGSKDVSLSRRAVTGELKLMLKSEVKAKRAFWTLSFLIFFLHYTAFHTALHLHALQRLYRTSWKEKDRQIDRLQATVFTTSRQSLTLRKGEKERIYTLSSPLLTTPPADNEWWCCCSFCFSGRSILVVRLKQKKRLIESWLTSTFAFCLLFWPLLQSYSCCPVIAVQCHLLQKFSSLVESGQWSWLQWWRAIDNGRKLPDGR